MAITPRSGSWDGDSRPWLNETITGSRRDTSTHIATVIFLILPWRSPSTAAYTRAGPRESTLPQPCWMSLLTTNSCRHADGFGLLGILVWWRQTLEAEAAATDVEYETRHSNKLRDPGSWDRELCARRWVVQHTRVPSPLR